MRLNITVNEMTYKRIQETKKQIRVNISAICQSAINKAIDDIEKDMQSIIDLQLTKKQIETIKRLKGNK